jgi:hypothetical protein
VDELELDVGPPPELVVELLELAACSWPLEHAAMPIAVASPAGRKTRAGVEVLRIERVRGFMDIKLPWRGDGRQVNELYPYLLRGEER